MSIRHITNANFEQEVMKSDKLVVVDFWATWCGPCRAIGPVVDELAQEYNGEVVIGKINVDEEGELSRKYKVMSIPTIMLFKNGEVIDKVVGLRSKEDLIELIDSNK
ncbi:MAG: thioredoxin [Clostridiales bacterium]|nr:thioredoxin [Clostridiales bacterium]